MNNPKTFIEPLGGYIVDLIYKIINKPFIPHSLTKLHNLKLCRAITGATTVVEIGTFWGVTAKRLSYLFNKVITVEIHGALYSRALKRCRNRKNIKLIKGDGIEVLTDISPTIKNAVLFLDGHYSGGITGHGDEPEPVLKELDIIHKHIDNFVAVVIDDFRLFGVENGWPKRSEVLEKAEKILPCDVWTHYVLNDQFIFIRQSKKI